MCDEAEDLLCGVGPPGELGEACGEKGVAAGSCANVVARCVGGVADSALFGGIGGKLAVVAGVGGLGGGGRLFDL